MSHRQLCRRYQTVYRCKLTEKVSEQVTKELAQLERELDAFNIILIRQKIENEVSRRDRSLFNEHILTSYRVTGFPLKILIYEILVPDSRLNVKVA